MLNDPGNRPYTVTRFRRALVHFIGGRAVQATARALLVLVLIRILEVEDYGVYMLLVGLSEMTLLVASFGLNPVGYRYLPEVISSVPYRKLQAFVVGLISLQNVILLGLTWLLYVFWDRLMPFMGFGPEQLETSRIGAWLFLLVPAFRYAASLLESLLEQGKAQISRALMPALRAAVLAILLLGGASLTLHEVLLIDIAVTAFCLLLAWYLLWHSLRRLHNTEAEGELPLGEMLHFGWHMTSVDLLTATAQPGAIRAALASSIGVVEAGLFAFLQSLQRLVGRYLPGVLLRGLIRPAMVSRAATPQGMKSVEAGANLLFKLNLIGVGASSVLIAAGGDELVSLLSGGKFTDAGLTLLLMFIGLGVMSQRSVIEMIMQITRQTNALLLTGALSAIALFLVWSFAEYGLNVAIMIIIAMSMLANSIATFVLTRGEKPFDIEFRGIIVIILAASLGVVLGLYLPRLMPVLLSGTIAATAFCFLIVVAKPFTDAELRLIERGAGRRVAAALHRLLGRTEPL